MIDNANDAIAVLRLMVAPYGARPEARALIYAIEELGRRQHLPAENERIRASRDRWRELTEQLIEGLNEDNDKTLANAIKAYRKLIKVPEETRGGKSKQ